MASLTYLTSTLLLASSFLASTTAQGTITSGSDVITATAIAGGFYTFSYTECPGVLSITGPSETDGFCCVGGNLDVSTCPGWPLCTGTDTAEPSSTSEVSCAASIPLTASDYSEQITSASSSFYGGQAASTDMPASTTASGSSSSITGTGSTSRAGGSSLAGPSSSSSSAGAGGVLIPAGAVAGGFLALAAML